MKRIVFFIIIGMCAISFPLMASGKVWSEVDEYNVATVHHDSAFFNCCPMMSFRRTIDDFLINIYEDDTTDMPCYCMCYYNFTHIFIGLKPGTYYVNVWERPYGDEFTLAGTTSFTIKGKNEDYHSYSERTDCLEGIKENINNDLFSLQFPTVIDGRSSIRFLFQFQLLIR